ncbi:hypothetical protein ACJJTC_016289 [Scirpophaga incertulas]
MYLIILIILLTISTSGIAADNCLGDEIFSKEKLTSLSKKIVPNLYKKSKGDAGRIAIIGGSTEYSGAPYFAAMSSLRVGADVVYVVTTEAAAPIVKAYSPALIVHPYLNKRHASKISQLIRKVDVVVIGPGFGREDDQIKLMLDIIQTCKNLTKALIIDADALFALSYNVDILENYPRPGVILTPNSREAAKLMMVVNGNDSNWYNYWGENVSVLLKGYEDRCYTSNPKVNWSLSSGGSERRSAGQAAKFTRACNARAYDKYGRSMIASDMLKKMHFAFNDVFQI